MDKTDYKKIANQYYEQDDIPNAILNYKKAIEVNPKDGEAYDELAVVYYFQDDFQNAIINYKKVIEISRNDLGIQNALGDAYFDNNDFENAILIYENLIKVDPNYKYLSYDNLEYIYLLQNNTVALIKLYKAKLSTGRYNSETSEIYSDFRFNYHFGRAYFKQDDFENALLYFQKCLNLTPESPMVCNAIGKIKIRQNLLTKTLGTLLKSWMSNKHEVNSMNIGQIYLLENNPKEALKWYQKSLELYIDSRNFFDTMESDYLDLKMKEKGISKTEYQTILEILRKEN